MNSLVTVIIPAYNGAAFLAEAVASIRANQYEPLEIRVVDDGSTDATVELARELGTHVMSQPHTGRPAAGRNIGIRLAHGEFVAFLDQDDLWTADKLTQQLACFQAETQLQVVWGHTQRLVSTQTSSGTKPVNGRSHFEAFGEPLDYRLVSGALFRKSVFDHVGLFDESLRYYGDDTDWFLRAREANVPMQRLDAVTLYWRLYDRNLSQAKIRDHAQGYDYALTEVLRKAMERRRQKEKNVERS